MTPERYRALASDPSLTLDQLLTMMGNAAKRGAPELVQIARAVLDERFPGWESPRKSGGPCPVTVTFRGTERYFLNSKEGYLWLVERFLGARPSVFDTPSWETVFLAVGRARNYFSPSLANLFHESPHLADDPNKYAKLSNGWYVNLNLDNARKYEILGRFGALAKLEEKVDWLWVPHLPSKDLVTKMREQEEGRKLLDDLRKR